MSPALATPLDQSATASRTSAACIRLATYPGMSRFTRIGALPQVRHIRTVRSTVASEVDSPRDTSTRGIS